MQNTRQAIITIESSMIYSLLSQSNIWRYQIALQVKTRQHFMYSQQILNVVIVTFEVI